MKKVFLSICLILFISATSAQPSKQISTPVEQLSGDNEAQTPFGNHGRIALAILNAISKDKGKNKKVKPTFLSHLDNDTSLKIIAEAFKSNFNNEEAALIVNFFESPEGQTGIRSYGNWSLRGKFLKVFSA